MPKICYNTHQSGASKLCIDPQCDLPNPFICEICEELHEHTGALNAVRIKKIHEIKQAITLKQTQIKNSISKIEKAMSQLKSKANGYLGRMASHDNKLMSMSTQFDKILNLSTITEGQPHKFHLAWNQVKQNGNIFSDREHSELIEQMNRFERVLQNVNKPDKQIDKEAPQQSNLQFWRNFTNVYLFLNLQLTSKPKDIVIESINSISAQFYDGSQLIKNQGLCLAKTLEILDLNTKAEQIYTALLKNLMFDTQILNRRALIRKKLKMYELAEEDFSELISLTTEKIPNPSIYYFQRAQIYQGLEKPEKAEKDYKKCLSDDNMESKYIFTALARVMEEQNQYNEAIKWRQKLIQVNRNIKEDQLVVSYTKLAELAAKMGDKALETKYLQSIKDKKVQGIEGLLRRAPLNHSIGKYREAIEDYTKIIEKIPDNPSLLYNRAVSLAMLNKKDTAINDLEFATKIDPEFKQANTLLANLSFELSQSPVTPNEMKMKYRSLSLKSYQKLLEKDQNNFVFWHNIGIMYTQQNPQKAFEAYSKAIELKPDYLGSYIGRIKLSLTLELPNQKILKDIYDSIALGNRNPQIFYIKAILEEQINQIEQALTTMTLVLKADPNNAEYLQTNIRLLIKSNSKEKAVEEIQKLYKMDPQKAKKYIKQSD